VSSDLPKAPDFEKMEALAQSSADQRTHILALIGNLNFTWSNNESMFIYVLMVLLKTDLQAAAITFITLNTTRARLDLIRRLCKARVSNPAIIRRVERLIRRFNVCTKIRNEFSHCIYQMNEKGEITHTNVLRIMEGKNELQISTLREIDEARLREISGAINRLTNLNRDLWEFLPILEKAVNAPENAQENAPENTQEGVGRSGKPREGEAEI